MFVEIFFFMNFYFTLLGVVHVFVCKSKHKITRLMVIHFYLCVKIQVFYVLKYVYFTQVHFKLMYVCKNN
jgi:hypothetical protein